MGFFNPRFPDVDPDEFLRKPLMERVRILTQSWVKYGFPSPRMVPPSIKQDHGHGALA